MKKLTQEEFEEKANVKHGIGEYKHGKYNGHSCLIELTHNKCKNVFKQSASMHLAGHGCLKCAGVHQPTTEEFLIKLFIKYPKNISLYGYHNCKYINAKKPIELYCYKCKKYFYQTPSNHLQGKGCLKCKVEERGKKSTFSTEKFLTKIFLKFPENISLFNYKNSKYENAITPINIFCNTCLKVFNQTPDKHYQGRGCSYCKSSNPEKQISRLLTKNFFSFLKEKRFENCKNINKLPFDFYLTDYNILIEFDGIQHFEPMSFSNNITQNQIQKNLEEVQYRDSIKSNWAKENNIPLIRISYLEEHLIEEKINKLCKFLKNNII